MVIEERLDLDSTGLARRVVERFAVLLQRVEVEGSSHHCEYVNI